MREKGLVVYATRNGGMLVVQHSDGFALVEMLGSEGEIVPGHVITGNWDELGGGEVYKEGEEYDVYYQGSWATKTAAIRVAGK